MLRKLSLNRLVKMHIVVWLIYIIYYGSLIKYFYQIPLSFGYVGQTILHRLGDVFLFYIIAFKVLPNFFSKKKIYLLIISLIGVLVIYIFYYFILEFYAFELLHIIIPNDTPTFNQVISQSIVQASNFIIFALGYYFSQRVIQQQKEISQQEVEISNQKLVLIKKEIELAEEREKNAILAKEKAQAEMAFLRAQINPHFLFNTLNLIYSKILTSTKDIAAQAVEDFSLMMQYATSTELQQDTVSLEGEIEFVERYLKLFKARNQQGAYIDYQKEGYFGNNRVVPMVMITIVENALKHGLVDDPNNPLVIRISLEDDFLVFMVRNLKNPYKDDVSGKGNTGIGIVNIIKRLNAVYKNGGFTLESEDLKDDYVVTFTVNYKLI